MKIGEAYLIVGAPGMGKTSFNRDKVKRVHEGARFIHDVNGEYKDLYPKKFLRDPVEFAVQASKKEFAFIIFEEATIYLSNRGSNVYVKEILVGKRHDNNLIFLVFHSLSAVPRYIYDLCNYVVLFKTGDNESKVETRFENEMLTKGFLQLRKAPLLVGSEGKKYSPHLIIPVNPEVENT